MNILLISSPMGSLNYPGVDVPNLGLLSIASHVDKKHRVKIIDSFNGGNYVNISSILENFKPEVIGLSCMSFQYESIRNLAIRIKSFNKSIKIVLGGYHATLMYREIFNTDDKSIIDFIIRNEGEYSFNELLNQIAVDSNFHLVPNLSFHINGNVYHNETIFTMDINNIKLPDRSLIGDNNYFFSVRGILAEENTVTIETSRGCVHSCSYCSIKLMYSTPYRAYPLNRVIEDIKNIEKFQRNVTRIAIVDDNITSDVNRFEQLCDLIIENKLNKYKYFCQCSCVGLASSGSLIKKMKLAGFDIVFIGIENNNAANLKFLGKGNIIDKTEIACKYLNKYKINIYGGVMIGCPSDDAKSIKDLSKYLKHLNVLIPAFQYITPYPKTKLREEYLNQNLIDNIDDYRYYDGIIPNIHTNHLTNLELFKTTTLTIRNYYIFYILRIRIPRLCPPGKRHKHYLNFIKVFLLYSFWRISNLFNMSNQMSKMLDSLKEKSIKETCIDKYF